MAFRYINPGYSGLIENNSSAADFVGTEFSNTGISFSQTSSKASITTQKLTTDLFCRFDCYYIAYSAVKLIFYSAAGAADPDAHGITYSSNSVKIMYYGYSLGTALKLTPNSLNKIWYHLHLSGDIATSYGELQVNADKTTVDFSGNRYYGFYPSAETIRIYSSSAQTTFSHIIISDTEISPKEQVVALPTSETVTNMTADGNGIYIADAVNQTLLQTVDVSTLIENYGASSAVTGIALVGNPAYKTATGLASLIGLSKNGTTVTEHGSCDLSDDTSAVISTGWATDNITIADLQGMQFGWKAGE